ncbi:MAG: TolC family protein [Bryobacteraceae bacterium]
MFPQSAGILVLIAASVMAQEPAEIFDPFSLNDALAVAEQQNPRLRVAAAQRAGAVAGITTARAYPNPEISFLGGDQNSRWNRGFPGPVGRLQHYSIAQPIELPGLRQARIEAAEFGQTSSEYAFEEAQLAVRWAVTQAFYQVLRRRGEIELAEENLRVVEDLRRRIQVQVDSGEAPRLELTRAEAELATARTFARSAQLRLVTALASLRALVNAPVNREIRPVGSLDPPMILPALDELRSRVLERHPSMAQGRAEIRRAEAVLRTERAARKPQPWLRTEYEIQPDLSFFRAGVTIPLPLLNKREGPIAEAVAQIHRARASLDMRRLELSSMLETAYGQYEVANQQVAAFADGVLREAEAALRATEAAYRFGERGIIEVLDAQRVLRSVRLDYLNAQFDRQSALIDLEQLRAIDAGQRTP